MQKLTIDDILKATGGKLLCGSADTRFSSITTDSRKAAEGVLFIPLVGDKFDGHEFINAAFEMGAAAVLTHKDTEHLVGRTIIKVNDTFTALADIARYYKAKYNLPTVAVTGSVGKTTTTVNLGICRNQRPANGRIQNKGDYSSPGIHTFG